MKTYELTYIISPQISLGEVEIAKKDIVSFIQEKEGIIIKSEKMGAQPLSYVISKQASGYFNVETFQIEEGKIKEIKDNLNKNNKVLRSILVIKKPLREVKERRTRRPMFTKEFEVKRKSSIMETKPYKDIKKEEKVDTADLDKKLDELLNE